MGDSPERAEWTIPVRDAVLRRTCDVVIAEAAGEVVVIPPAAHGYIVPDDQHAAYLDALNAARSVARSRRRPPRGEVRP